MAGTREWFSFSVKQAWVAEYSESQAASWVEIPVMASSTVDAEITQEVVRDGLGYPRIVWFHSRGATVNLVTRKWSMRILEMISGNPVSSGSVDKIEFGREEELTPPYVRMKLRAYAREDDSSSTQYMDVYLYKVQCQFPSIGMDETSPGEITITGTALHSEYDDQAQQLATKALGRIEALVSS